MDQFKYSLHLLKLPEKNQNTVNFAYLDLNFECFMIESNFNFKIYP